MPPTLFLNAPSGVGILPFAPVHTLDTLAAERSSCASAELVQGIGHALQDLNGRLQSLVAVTADRVDEATRLENQAALEWMQDTLNDLAATVMGLTARPSWIAAA
jgi:hypothetical protein